MEMVLFRNAVIDKSVKDPLHMRCENASLTEVCLHTNAEPGQIISAVRQYLRTLFFAAHEGPPAAESP